MRRGGYRLNGRKSWVRLPEGAALKKTAFILVALLWSALVAVSYIMLARNAVTRTNSHNAALLQTLKGDIASLPNVSSIAPGRTSQNMSYVIESRKELISSIQKGNYTPTRPSILFALYPAFYTVSRPFPAHQKALADVKAELQNSIDDMTGLQKFVEYMPAVDLENPLTPGAETTDRLQRTQAGLNKTAAFLQTRSLNDSDSITSEITNLAQAAPSLTDTTKAAWVVKLLPLQTSLLKSIAARDIQATSFSRSLDALSARYQ